MQNKKAIHSALFASLVIILLAGLAIQAKTNGELKEQLSNKIESSDETVKELKEEISTLKKPQAKEVTKETEEEANDDSPVIQEDFLSELFKEEVLKGTENDEEGAKYISISPEVFDFGDISKKDGPVTANYTIKNKGGRDLTISYAFTSCGCTVTPLKDEVIIKPNEEMPLEVVFDPNFYGPKIDLGEITKTVTVLSNDPSKPFYKVKLKANVTP